MTTKPATIAIFNSNEDTIELLRFYLEQAGFNTVAAHVSDIQRGETDIVDFVKKHEPEVIVYDVPPPYDRSWIFAKLLRNTEALKPRKFVYTTTNSELLKKFVPEIHVFQLVQKPYDFEEIVKAVIKELGVDAA
jgi:CheY-like chemotaxis protein